MESCEREIRENGFRSGELSATLVGEPLYRKFGYVTTNHYEIELPGQLQLKVARMIKTYTAESQTPNTGA